MIYRFKIISDEVDDFRREIRIDSENTFLDLRDAIIDSVGYSKEDLSSFVICDDDWTRRQEILLADMGFEADRDFWLMADTRLSEMIEDEGQKLMFIFDAITERAFFMEMKEIITGSNLSKPECTLRKGNPPRQTISLEEFDKSLEKISTTNSDFGDLDFDAYGEGYNPEDIPDMIDDEYR